MKPEDEAARLVRLFESSPKDLIVFLSGQLSVLKSQAQVLMGLCGLIITVTGFSGHNMVRGGVLSSGAMIAGIGFVTAAIALTLGALARVKWVSQALGDDLRDTATLVIARRNREQRVLSFASVCVALGLALYLLAVVLAALARGDWTPP